MNRLCSKPLSRIRLAVVLRKTRRDLIQRSSFFVFTFALMVISARAQDPLAAVDTGSTTRSTAPWYDYDGAHILGAIGSTVYLWDARTGTILKTFGPHGEFVHLARFSPDGKYVLTISHTQPADFEIPHPDSATRLWDLKTGKLLWRIEGALYAKFSVDGTRILLTSVPSRGKSTSALLESPSGKKLTQVKGSVWSLAISPDDSTFVADDFFRARDGHRIGSPKLDGHGPSDFSTYGNEGDIVVSGDGMFDIWSHVDGSKRSIPASEGGPRANVPTWTSDGAYVFSFVEGLKSRRVSCRGRIWAVSTGESITPSLCPLPGGEATPRPQNHQVLARITEPDDDHPHRPSMWALYDLRDGHVIWQAELGPGFLGFAPDGRTFIALAGAPRETLPDHTHATVYDSETGKPLRTVALQHP